MKKLLFIISCILLTGCSQMGEDKVPSTSVITTVQYTEKTEISSDKISEAVSVAETFDEETPETSDISPEPETPDVNYDTVMILGPNMVYSGENFDYRFECTDENIDISELMWVCDGEAGIISSDGHLEGVKKGTVILKLVDALNRLADELEVHIIESVRDVDFVPMVSGIPIANKTYPLPADYDPGLSEEAYNAFLELKQAAAEEQLDIIFMSGYRSYAEQQRVYGHWNEVYSNNQADRISARPGHSEHQLGLAIDVNSTLFEFADTPEGIWLAENCYKYGFIIRYPEGTESITGYMYEPWHIRYLGKDIAEKVHNSGVTLEEYLGIDSYYREEYQSEG